MLQMSHLFTLPALIGFVCFASSLLLVGTFDCWLRSGSQLSLTEQAPYPRATSPCALGLPPKPPLPKEGFPGLATPEEACVALTTDTKFFTCPTKVSICCCWYLSCLVSSSCLVGGTVAAAALALGTALAWPAFPSYSDFLHSSKKCM